MCIAKQVACSSVAVYACIVACYANNWLRKHKRHRLRVLATSTRRGRAPECLILIVAKTRLSGNFKVPVYIHIIEREREVVLGGGRINSGSCPLFGTESGLVSLGLPKHQSLACMRLHDQAPPPHECRPSSQAGRQVQAVKVLERNGKRNSGSR